MGHKNSVALSSTTTQAEVTLLSAVEDNCTTLAAPHDATPEAKQICLNHQCWLMRMVMVRGLRRLVTTGYANWSCRQATETGYAGWLQGLVTTTGYASWLWRLVKVMIN